MSQQVAFFEHTPEAHARAGQTAEPPPPQTRPASKPKTEADISPLRNGLARMPIWVKIGLGAVICFTAGLYLNHSWKFRESQTPSIEADVHPTSNDYTEIAVTPVSSNVAGDVLTVLVGDHQLVEKGQPLVLLDPREINERLVSAKAAFMQASERHLQAEESLNQALTALHVAEIERSVSMSQLEKLQWNLARVEDLYHGPLKVITRRELDSAQSAVDSARETAAATTASLEKSVACVQTAKDNMTAAKTESDLAQKTLSDIELQLSYTTLHAPAAGRIAMKSAEPGQRILPGQALMSVVSKKYWVSNAAKHVVKNDSTPTH